MVLKNFRSLALVLLALLFAPVSLRAQGTVSGQETTIVYTGTNATITPPGTPANNFVTPNGTNTFLLPIAQPAVSVRVYITNNTANACASTFTLQMFAASDTQTSSFNNSLANWQTIPLQDTDGTLVQIATPNIPASGVAYVSSTVVAAPRVAIQLINANILNCPATTVEVTATITPIALTSPLISTNSPSGFNSGSLNQIQGVVANGGNGATVNPVVAGALANPINGNFLNQGVDNFGSTTQVITNGFAGTFNWGTVPRPSRTGEWTLAFIDGGQDTATSTLGANSGWSCNLNPYTPGGCTFSVNSERFLSLQNTSANTALLQTMQNGNGTQNANVIFVAFRNTPVVRQQSDASRSGAFGVPAALAGSVTLVGVACGTSSPCVSALGSALGMNYQLLVRQSGNASFAFPGMDIWIAGNLSPGGTDTITPTFTAGNTTALFNYIEMTGMNPSTLNQPNIPNQADSLGNQVIRLDAQAPDQFACNVTLSTNTTTTCQPATTTINGVAVRAYVTDFQINTTTAGTATTIQLKTGTGANCGTGTANLSAILYPNTVVGITNILGTRTPLVAPLQNAVCATQAGTTAGTSVVEIRGFLAP